MPLKSECWTYYVVWITLRCCSQHMLLLNREGKIRILQICLFHTHSYTAFSLPFCTTDYIANNCNPQIASPYQREVWQYMGTHSVHLRAGGFDLMACRITEVCFSGAAITVCCLVLSVLGWTVFLWPFWGLYELLLIKLFKMCCACTEVLPLVR